jgi:hypothetical protein
MSRTVAALSLTFYLTACGGGSGGGSGSTPAPEPPPTNPDSEPMTVVLLDSIPGPGVTNVEPEQLTSSFSHPGHSDLSLELSGDCSGFVGTTIRRSLFDLSMSDFNQLLDHKIICNLDENTAYTITANGTRSNEAEFIAELFISTGVTNPSGLTLLNEFDLP